MKKTFAVVIALVAILVVGVGVAAAAWGSFTIGLALLPETLAIGYDMNCDEVVDDSEIIATAPIADGRPYTFDPDEFSVTFDMYPGAESHRLDVWVGGYGPGYFIYNADPAYTFHHEVFGEYCPNCGHLANQIWVGPMGDMSTWTYTGDFPECCTKWLNLEKVLWNISITPETFEKVYDPVHERYEYVYTQLADPISVPEWFYILFY